MKQPTLFAQRSGTMNIYAKFSLFAEVIIAQFASSQ